MAAGPELALSWEMSHQISDAADQQLVPGGRLGMRSKVLLGLACVCSPFEGLLSDVGMGE